jgi:hypothetical protein
VSEPVATYGLSEPAVEKTVAVLELTRAVHTEPLVRGELFHGSADIYRHFGPRIRDLKVERFFAVVPDGEHRILR